MQLCPATVLKCQEAIPISNNEMRKIHRGGEEQPARPMGRKVNVSQSRREVHSAAENRTRTPKAPKSPKPPKEKSKHPIPDSYTHLTLPTNDLVKFPSVHLKLKTYQNRYPSFNQLNCHHKIYVQSDILRCLC